MDRSVARFSSHQEAEKAARLYYQQLSPARRLEILLELRERFQDPGDASSERLERVIESLNSQHVEYVIVGGFGKRCS